MPTATYKGQEFNDVPFISDLSTAREVICTLLNGPGTIALPDPDRTIVQLLASPVAAPEFGKILGGIQNPAGEGSYATADDVARAYGIEERLDQVREIATIKSCVYNMAELLMPERRAPGEIATANLDDVGRDTIADYFQKLGLTIDTKTGNIKEDTGDIKQPSMDDQTFFVNCMRLLQNKTGLDFSECFAPAQSGEFKGTLRPVGTEEDGLLFAYQFHAKLCAAVEPALREAGLAVPSTSLNYGENQAAREYFAKNGEFPEGPVVAPRIQPTEPAVPNHVQEARKHGAVIQGLMKKFHISDIAHSIKDNLHHLPRISRKGGGHEGP